MDIIGRMYLFKPKRKKVEITHRQPTPDHTNFFIEIQINDFAK